MQWACILIYLQNFLLHMMGFFYLFAGLLVKETIFKKSTSKYFSIGAIINKCWGILYIFFSHLLVGNNFEIPTCYHGYC